MASSVTGDVNSCQEKLEKEPGKYFYLLLCHFIGQVLVTFCMFSW